jgi:hypothetical protein
MKKFMIRFVLAGLFFFPLGLFAQSPIDKVFEKYAGKDGFTTVNISKEMFQMFGEMAASSDSSKKEMQQVMGQLTGLKVLSFESDSANLAKVGSVFNEFSASFPASSYKELMAVNDDGENIRFLTKQEKSGKVSEMVMLMKDKDECMVLSLTGNIDLSTISSLSKGMNIHGMENLKKIKEKHDK